MRPERLTKKAQEALQTAAQEALLRQEGGIARSLLEAAGAFVSGLQVALVSRVERLPRVSGQVQIYLGTELARALDQAEKEAQALKNDYVSTEHILLALAENPACGPQLPPSRRGSARGRRPTAPRSGRRSSRPAPPRRRG
jgi:ATP-dependent Clp protease ATP-binding subunit ClpB